MEEFVQLKLETYDNLMKEIESLTRNYGVSLRENRGLIKIIEDAEKKYENTLKGLEKYILNMELQTLYIEKYSLEQVTNIESYVFGIHNRHELSKLGITEEDMIDFITKKWNEMHQEEKENA